MLAKPTEISVPDRNALTVKICNNGYRLMRGKGSNRPFVFIRSSELTNLADLLIDAYESNHNQ